MNSKKLFLSMTLFMCLFAWTAKAGVTKTVGTTGADFPTLFDAIAAVNSNADGISYSGAVELQIIDNTIEPALIAITASTVRTSLLIYPTVGGKSISGDLSSFMIILDGATNVTFDGRVNHIGATRNLTIVNTGGTDLTKAGTVLFKTDASKNCIKYCTIKGSGTGIWIGTISFTSNTTGLGNNANKISNNIITNADPNYRPTNSIFSQGTVVANKLDTISNNDFVNFFSPSMIGSTSAMGIKIHLMNDSWAITGNSFYETTTFAPTQDGEYSILYIGSGSNHTISANYFGGSAAKCGGTAFTKTTGNNLFRVMLISASTSPASTVQGNTIKNFNWTNSANAVWNGINVGSGAVNITANTIGDQTTNGSITFTEPGGTSSGFYTVMLQSTGTSVFTNNTIGSISIGNSDVQGAGTVFYGLFDQSTGTTTISGNTFGSPTVANSICSFGDQINQFLYGIRERATGTTTISGNTFNNMSNSSKTDGTLSCMRVDNGTNIINSNCFTGLSFSNTASNGTINGIDISAASAISISNNIISLNTTTNTNMNGIQMNTTGSAVNNLYFNTINIGGSQPSGSTAKSYCINSSNTATFIRDFRNNILTSTRSTVGGTKLHYSLFAAAGSGTFTCNYNDYYVSGVGSVLGNFAAIDKNSVPIVTGQTGNDAGSLNLNPGFANAVGTSAVDFKTSAVLAGVAGTGILVDYANVARGATPRMGAYETIISGLNNHQMSFPYRLNHTSTGIHVTFDGEASIELYTIGGQMIDKLKATDSYSHNLNNGVFVIRINGKTSKFIM